jgi:hypothetical protein
LLVPIRSYAAFGEVLDDVDQVAQLPAEGVEFPHNQGVSGTWGLEAGALVPCEMASPDLCTNIAAEVIDAVIPLEARGFKARGLSTGKGFPRHSASMSL